jgi:electron-transferring-flavoprotein dehydrogenase
MPSLLMPKLINNHGNYIISLGQLCEWLAEQAEELGVEIIPGFAGDQVLFDQDGNGGVDERVIGVRTGDMGIAKDGTLKDGFEPGCDIIAK